MNNKERPRTCANRDNCSIDGKWCLAISVYVADIKNVSGCKNWKPL